MTGKTTNANIGIRRATEQDLPRMVELWKDLMDFHATRDPIFTRKPDGEKAWETFMRENMAKDKACVFAAEGDRRIVGYCLALISNYPPVLSMSTYGEMMDLMVHEAYRHRCVGERLFNAAKAWYSQQGIYRIEVRVAVTNEISTGFWRKMGFKPYLETLALSLTN
jgi:ribosomal protein S18 acetylase RimI-like enzyme